jgi:WD40 repeat protein
LRHAGPILSAAFSPDGGLVATAGEDRTARLWNTATGRQLGPTLKHDEALYAVAFHPDGRSFFTAGESCTARRWPTPTPLEGPVEPLRLAVEVATGLELGEADIVRPLDGKLWAQRRAGMAGRDVFGSP